MKYYWKVMDEKFIQEVMKEYDDMFRIILFGGEEEADNIEKYILDNFHNRYWGRLSCRQHENENGRKCVFREIEELFYEDTNKIIAFVIEPRLMHKAVSELLDVGILHENIKPLILEIAAGTPFIKCFDVQLGYTRIFNNMDKYAGFQIFGDANFSLKGLRVLTLGGSTTDALQANLVSWSEYLYTQLSRMYDNVQVICGGIASMTVSQELVKLIRDGLLFKPDIVISYSGVNDGVATFHDNINPFVQHYHYQLVKQCIEDVEYRDRIGNPIYESVDCCVKGVDPLELTSNAEHWIMCERMMHSICKEFGIEFIGILQPQNDDCDSKYAEERKPFYKEAKAKVEKFGEKWLLDFTEIFKGYTDIYYDDCHVYERGNRIIVRNMMTYVLDSIRRRRNVGIGDFGIIP